MSVPDDVRRPVVAGSFYPSEPHELVRLVDALLAEHGPSRAGRPAGLIVPHAGYVYSGPIAAAAYAAIRPWAAAIGRVVVLGPAHFVPLVGCAVSSAAAWRTPLGDVPVDDAVRAAALAAVGVVVDDEAHAPEHAIEVQLPFLQRALPDGFAFLPVAVGEASPDGVAAVLDAVATTVDLIVVSTDLSHYQDDATARSLDRRTADAVVALQPEAIGPADACGRHALRGVVEHARRRGLAASLLRLGTSAETGGEAERVVGYGAFAIEPCAGGPEETGMGARVTRSG